MVKIALADDAVYRDGPLSQLTVRVNDGPYKGLLTTFERNFILRALERNGWNVTATARALGIPLSTLKFKMDKLEVRKIAQRIRGN